MAVPRHQQVSESSTLPYLFHYGTEATIQSLFQFYNICSTSPVCQHLIVNRGQRSYRTVHLYADSGLKDYLQRTSAQMPDTLSPDALGQTVLHRAARDGNSALVQRLLNTGFAGQLETRDNNGRTPLHLAIYSGNEPTVQALLTHGANKEAKDRVDYSPLHWAAFFGHTKLARLLVKHHANPRAGDRLKITPLHLAAYNGHADTVHYLTEVTDVNQQAFNQATALHYAAFAGHLDSVAVLLDQGALDNLKTSRGYTPKMLADSRHFVAVSQILPGAVKPVANTDFTVPDLPLVCTANTVNPVEPDATDQHGYTALHRAAREGDAAQVALLIENGSDPEKRHADGWQPLHIAAGYGHPEVVRPSD